MATRQQRAPGMTGVRVAYIAVATLWAGRVAANMPAPRQGVYEWAVSIGWATIISCVALSAAAGIASSARRMARRDLRVSSRLERIVTDLASSIVAGIAGFLLGEIIEARPAYTALISLMLGWGGAQALDSLSRRFLDRFWPDVDATSPPPPTTPPS